MVSPASLREASRVAVARDALPDRRIQILLALIACIVLSIPARGGTPAETNLFNLASRQFVSMLYPQAEMNFSNFVATYTNSPQLPQALLFQARSRIGQSNYAGALELLQKYLPTAGALGADYVFWIAEAHFERGRPEDYEATITGCSNFLIGFPTSNLRLRAAYYEALAHSRRGESSRATELLSTPGNPFDQSARADPNNEFAVSGWLLLGESYLAQRQYTEGDKVVEKIAPAPLPTDYKWRRQYLLCRLELADGEGDQALEDSTNLVELAVGDLRQTDTTFLRARILEKLNRIPEAIQTYTNNLEKRFPADVQRRALVKAIELLRAQNQTPEALAQLQDFIATHAGSPALDAACALLGDLYLKAYAVNTNSVSQTNGPPQAGTNFFVAAATNLDRVIRDFAQGEFLGKARLDRGWCDWCQGKIAEARTNFQEAVNHLPLSPEQAEARFKLADAQFEQKDYGGAKANYTLLLEQYTNMPAVTNELFDQALYQTVQACVRMGDGEGAALAANKLLDWFPDSYFGERGLLLVGEDKNRNGNYAAARAIFNELIDRFPKTPQVARYRFAVARTYDYEGNFTQALASYIQWANSFPSDPLLPNVEFARALVLDKLGQETNALTCLTNFLARFPSNNLSALAQNWIADYYWNNNVLDKADYYFQQLYQNPLAGSLAFEARMMAGRANFALHDYPHAYEDFKEVANAAAAPPALRSQGIFALGDSHVELFHASATNSAELEEAIKVLSFITNATPSNSLAILALGKLGDCYVQWADFKKDPVAYATAAQMYQAALNLYATTLRAPPPSVPPRGIAPIVETADVATRNQLEAGLGLVAERLNQPDQALEYYSRVLFADDSDPFWVEQAGEKAARICEDRGQWGQTVRIYTRVLQAVPSLRPTLANRIAAAQTRADATKH